jgi:hypothetical protein
MLDKNDSRLSYGEEEEEQERKIRRAGESSDHSSFIAQRISSSLTKRTYHIIIQSVLTDCGLLFCFLIIITRLPQFHNKRYEQFQQDKRGFGKINY